MRDDDIYSAKLQCLKVVGTKKGNGIAFYISSKVLLQGNEYVKPNKLSEKINLATLVRTDWIHKCKYPVVC